MTFAMVRRIAREKRVMLIPLVTTLIANGLVTGAVVFPLSGQVRSAEQQERQAAAALRGAEVEHATAVSTLARKQRAETDLEHFYSKVLPITASDARRQTYIRLANLARDADLRSLRRLEEVQAPKPTGTGPASILSRFVITMVLRGEYDSVRQFIRDIEASEEFVSIDDMTLAEGNEPGSPLVLNLILSTYFRTPADER